MSSPSPGGPGGRLSPCAGSRGGRRRLSVGRHQGAGNRADRVGDRFEGVLQGGLHQLFDLFGTRRLEIPLKPLWILPSASRILDDWLDRARRERPTAGQPDDEQHQHEGADEQNQRHEERCDDVKATDTEPFPLLLSLRHPLINGILIDGTVRVDHRCHADLTCGALCGVLEMRREDQGKTGSPIKDRNPGRRTSD